MTSSPIGEYDRNTTLVVTQRDGSQQFYPRKTKSGFHQLAPLNWWKKCGIFTEERDQWAKSVIHPEHVQIMKHAGIAADDLFGTILSPSDVENVLGWFNVYREVYGEKPASLLAFRKFMSNVAACGAAAQTANPLKVGNYVKHFMGTMINMDAYLFLLNDQDWIDVVRERLAGLHDNVDYRQAVKTLMQLGATPDALRVLTNGHNDFHSGTRLNEAITAFAIARQFTPHADCYREIKQLAEIMHYMPGHKKFCCDLFLDLGTDRERFHTLVTVEKITSPLPLGAILKEEVPSALVGGFL